MTNSNTHRYSVEEASRMRTDYLTGPFRVYLSHFFEMYPEVNSITLGVSQYYNDEAEDAVHNVLFAVTCDKEGYWPSTDWTRHTRTIKGFYFGYDHTKRVDSIYGWNSPYYRAGWSCNDQAISLFSCFCAEDNGYDATPIASFSRNGQYTFFGEKLRPYLEGVNPSWYSGDEYEDHHGGIFCAIKKYREDQESPQSLRFMERRYFDYWERESELLRWDETGPQIRADYYNSLLANESLLADMWEEKERRRKWDLSFEHRVSSDLSREKVDSHGKPLKESD